MRLPAFSIKWKITWALIALSLTLILAYVFIAKDLFEKDKISYVYESQEFRLQGLSRAIQSDFERVLFSTRAALMTFDLTQGQLSASAENLIREDNSLLALEIIKELNGASLLHFEKKPGTLPSFNPVEGSEPLGQAYVSSLGQSRFLVTFRYTGKIANESVPLLLRIVFENPSLMPVPEPHQLYLLTRGNSLLDSPNQNIDFSGLMNELTGAAKEHRIEWTYQGTSYLVSSMKVGLGRLQLVALTPKQSALGALGTLMTRSVLFLMVSFFALILMSLTLAKSITVKLGQLAQTAKRIGQGDFKTASDVTSEDEMGALAESLQHMAHDIQSRFDETEDKLRKEFDSQTAKLVQDQLIPQKAEIELGEIQICGGISSSRNYNGSWWYHFQRNSDIYIVTSETSERGTTAALMTAATRSIFSRLESENLTLPEMMRAWDKAIRSCSQGLLFGMILKINSETGVMSYVGSSFEIPIYIRTDDNGFTQETLPLASCQPIGSAQTSEYPIQSFTLHPHETLVLHSHGSILTSAYSTKAERSADKQKMGDLVAGHCEFVKTAQDVTESIFKVYPDETMIVSVRRTGPIIIGVLETESSVVSVGLNGKSLL